MATPLGGLRAFGPGVLTFDPTKTTAVKKAPNSYLRAVAYAGGAFPVRLHGLGAAPRDDVTKEWDVLVLAAPTLSGQAAYSDVVAQLGAMEDAVNGSYVLSLPGQPPALVSGQVGYLQVYTDGTATDWVQALAFCHGIPPEMQPGYVTGRVITLTFSVLEDWAPGS